MNDRDLARIRSLAAHQMELAQSDANIKLVELWKKHNMCRGERPMIHIETGTFAREVLDPQLQCEDPFARAIERNLIDACINLELYNDDKAVPPYYQMRWNTRFELFGHEIKETVLHNSDGVETGHIIEHIIEDLEEDFDKILMPSEMSVNKAATFEQMEKVNEAIGDILPVKLVSDCLYAVPTQKIVRMMGMENMFCAMYEYPELFMQMMERVGDAYLAYFDLLEKENVLMQTRGFEWLAQGSFAFYDEPDKEGPIKSTDVWGFLDSQETVGVSPAMFHEFIFPCYARIAERFGRLSYGCCEPVHTFWDDIKTLPNLKKVSISPWCDEEFMADKLRGSSTIYHRKPSPNYLGIGAALDEEAFRKHIDKTVTTARGCTLEIAQRDVYTVNRDIKKVRRYVEIIRESIDKNWR